MKVCCSPAWPTMRGFGRSPNGRWRVDDDLRTVSNPVPRGRSAHARSTTNRMAAPRSGRSKGEALSRLDPDEGQDHRHPRDHAVGDEEQPTGRTRLARQHAVDGPLASDVETVADRIWRGTSPGHLGRTWKDHVTRSPPVQRRRLGHPRTRIRSLVWSAGATGVFSALVEDDRRFERIWDDRSTLGHGQNDPAPLRWGPELVMVDRGWPYGH